MGFFQPQAPAVALRDGVGDGQAQAAAARFLRRGRVSHAQEALAHAGAPEFDTLIPFFASCGLPESYKSSTYMRRRGCFLVFV